MGLKLRGIGTPSGDRWRWPLRLPAAARSVRSACPGSALRRRPARRSAAGRIPPLCRHLPAASNRRARCRGTPGRGRGRAARPAADRRHRAGQRGGGVGRTDLLGGWTITSGGDSCQLFMTLTSWTGGYRASTRGCNSDRPQVDLGVEPATASRSSLPARAALRWRTWPRRAPIASTGSWTARGSGHLLSLRPQRDRCAMSGDLACGGGLGEPARARCAAHSALSGADRGRRDQPGPGAGGASSRGSTPLSQDPRRAAGSRSAAALLGRLFAAPRPARARALHPRRGRSRQDHADGRVLRRHRRRRRSGGFISTNS